MGSLHHDVKGILHLLLGLATMAASGGSARNLLLLMLVVIVLLVLFCVASCRLHENVQRVFGSRRRCCKELALALADAAGRYCWMIHASE